MLKIFIRILLMCLNSEYILISDYNSPLNVTVRNKVRRLKRGDKKPSLKHKNNLGME